MKGKYLFGIIITLLGLGIILTSFNFFMINIDAKTIVLTIIFIIAIIYSLLMFRWFFFFFFLGLGFAVLASSYGFYNYNASGVVLGSVLVGGGVEFFAQRIKKASCQKVKVNVEETVEFRSNDAHFNEEDDEAIFINNRFGRTQKIIVESDIHLININNDFGRLDLHFNNTNAEYKVVIDLNGNGSLTNIYLPLESYVDMRVKNFLSVVQFEEGNANVEINCDKFLIKGKISLAKLRIYLKD